MPLLKSRRTKLAVAIALGFLILVGAAFGYLVILLSGLNGVSYSAALARASVTGYVNNQGLLSYDNGEYELPYLSVVYNAPATQSISAEGGVYLAPTPTHLYILNYSGGCFRCGNATTAVKALIAGIKGYGMNGLYANTTNISIGDLSSIKNDSILVIVTGLIPSELAANNFSAVNALLAKQTSIIYVGRNFSSTIVSGVVPEPAPYGGRLPSFLNTLYYRNKKSDGTFAFHNTTFAFTNGMEYHLLTYENVGNGSIVAFPNTLSSWPSEQQAGADIAKAIWQMFWLPRYAVGTTSSSAVPSGGIGTIGIVMNMTTNSTPLRYNLTLSNALSSGYYRIAIAGVPSYPGRPDVYTYITGRPSMNTRGIVSLPEDLNPNQSGVQITFTLTSAPVKPTKLSTFITVYNQNLVKTGWVEQGPSVDNFSSSTQTSFYNYYNVGLGPGHYIIMLTNFSDNTEIAAGYFVIPSYVITPVISNFSSGTFVIKITSGGKPINNIAYNLSINNIYNSSGVVHSGIVSYQFPQGAPLSGSLDFNLGILHQRVPLTITRRVFPFTLNPQYIELIVVVVMMALMIAFVKAPVRDEFYIDVPNLPESKKVEIKLKAADVLTVFDKLNMNYHWKYMPLSKTEMKSAVAINIKYKNIPVELTYRNIDSMLDSLLVKGYIVGADELYAPATWIPASKHDIGYLATFKKLRIYFVTHSYTFTDLDASEESDMVATIHGDKKYVVIYSDTTKFKNIPIYPGGRTYLVFLNSDVLEEFRTRLFNTSSDEVEKLKMYISADYIRLVDADNLDRTMG
jgi:ribosome-associated toxin RatA of RatAB toxin-antitoxin module